MNIKIIILQYCVCVCVCVGGGGGGACIDLLWCLVMRMCRNTKCSRVNNGGSFQAIPVH